MDVGPRCIGMSSTLLEGLRIRKAALTTEHTFPLILKVNKKYYFYQEKSLFHLLYHLCSANYVTEQQLTNTTQARVGTSSTEFCVCTRKHLWRQQRTKLPMTLLINWNFHNGLQCLNRQSALCCFCKDHHCFLWTKMFLVISLLNFRSFFYFYIS